MAENEVSFRISADTRPAKSALETLRDELSKIKPIKSIDPQTNKQQQKLLTILKGVNEVLDANQKSWKLYNANVTRVKNLTAALEAQKEKTQEAQQALTDFAQVRGSMSDKDALAEEQRLQARVNEELDKEAKLTNQLTDYKARVAKVDTEAEQALEHILGKNKEIVADESSLLGYKLQDRDLSAEAAKAAEQTAQSENAAAAAARQNADATNDAAKAVNNLNAANKDGIAQPQKRQTKGEARPVGAPTDLAKAAEEAKRVAEEFANVKSKVNDALNFKSAGTDIASLTEKLLKLQSAQKAIEKMGMPQEFHSQYNQIYTEIERTKQAISAYKQSMQGIDSENKKAEKSSVSFGQKASRAFSLLKKGASGIGGILSSIKSGFKGLSKHTDKARSSFDSMARNMRSNFKHMLTNITKYVFGFRSLFFLIRRLRKYLIEGITNLVKYEAAIGQSKRIDSTNQAINRLKSSLLFLQNAWGAAFAPAIQVISRFLSPLIDAVARAGNAVARFMAVLTGQKTVLNAVKVPAKDYAKSLEKAGSGAGKAAKKQKQLNDRLADFDVLHVLGKDNDPNNGAGSGGGSGNNDDDYDFSKMFKRVKAVSKLADLIKQAMKTADFTKVGEYIRDKLVNTLDKVFSGKGFEKALKKASNIGKSIATFLNGLFQDEKLWVKLGEAIGKSFNLVGTALESFFKNNKVDWGKGLAALINSLFDNIDEDLLKSNIKSFVDLIVDNVVSFLENLKWEELQNKAKAIGEGLGYALERTFKNPEFAKALGKATGELVNTIGELITGVLSPNKNGGVVSAVEAMKTSNTSSIGTTIAEFIMSAFKTIKWKDFADTISTVLKGLFDAISDFFDHEEDLDEVAVTLGQAFEQLDWNGIIIKAVNAALKVGKFGTKIFAMISNAISQAIIDADSTEIENAVRQFIEEINTDDFMDSCEILGEAFIKSLIASGALLKVAKGVVGGIINAITDNFRNGENDETMNGLAEVGKFLANKILFGIGGVFLDIASWIRTNIIEPLYNGFMDNLSAEDTNPENLGSAIVSGLATGIANEFKSPLDWVKTVLVDPIVNGFTSLFQINSPSKVTEGWGGYLIEGLANGLTNAVSSVTTFWTNLKTSITTTWNGTVTNVLTATELLKSKFTEIWEKIKGAIKAPIQGILDIVGKLINGIIDGINDVTKKLNSLPSLKFVNPFSGKDYKLGFQIPQLSKIKVPKLAEGAVIPPNREFMAMLGDQSHGTNIEAPLDTIKQAVAEVIANNGNQEMIQLLQQLIAVVESKNLVIGDKEIGRANARYTNQQRMIRGTSF